MEVDGIRKRRRLLARCVGRRLITVEPFGIVFCFANFLTQVANQEYVFYRSCLSRFNSTSYCQIIDTSDAYESDANEVQSVAVQFMAFQTIAAALPGIIPTFILGAWSDRLSMMLPFLVPNFGLFSTSICTLAIVYFEADLYWMLISSGVFGCCGGVVSLFMAIYTYISHPLISDPQSRGNRIAIFDAAMSIAAILSYAVSGLIVRRDNFLLVYFVIAGLWLLALVYVSLFLEHLHSMSEIRDRKGSQSWLSLVFDIKADITDCARALFKRREGLARKHIIFAVLCFNTWIFGVYAMSANMLYLYLAAYPISFTHVSYGLYKAIDNFTSFLGNTLVIPLLYRFASISDIGVILLGNACWIVYCIFQLYHTKVFAFAALAMKFSSTFPAIGARAFYSKIVPSNEVGKVFAASACLESFAFMFSAFALNTVYKDTIDVINNGGFVFILFASFFLLSNIFAFAIYIDLQPINAS